MGVMVAVCTYGDESWIQTAQRAIASAAPQGPVIHRHGETLAAARNAALHEAGTEWIVFLDADDELEPGYITTLMAGTADVRAPAVRYVTSLRPSRAPYVPRVAGHRHACTGDCLEDGNWLVVGSLIRRDLAVAAGGWHEWPLYEDWDLFLRLKRAGASFEAIPDAIYRAHVRMDSRNRAPSMAAKNAIHAQIVAANRATEAA